jgi:hypothetical protein
MQLNQLVIKGSVLNLLMQIGTWFSHSKPEWESNLETLTDDKIRLTGLSREKLKYVLEIMHDQKVIK